MKIKYNNNTKNIDNRLAILTPYRKQARILLQASSKSSVDVEILAINSCVTFGWQCDSLVITGDGAY